MLRTALCFILFVRGKADIYEYFYPLKDLFGSSYDLVRGTLGGDVDTNKMVAVNQEDVKFHLLNRALPPEGVAIDVTNSTEYLKSVFLPGRDIKVAVHGWLGSDRSAIVKDITTVYVEEKDVNGIRVDWSSLADSYMYPMSAFNVDGVGTKIAGLMDHLVANDVTRTESIHLIGHSLGAHVVGTAGSKMTTGKPARVTGLDPARPGFEFLDELTPGTLDPSDGEFVDIIHTAGGVVGYLNPLGHADFFPNGGTPPQPGCLQLSNPLNNVVCSHTRSHEYYIESIKSTNKKFRSVQCNNWNSYTRGECQKNRPAVMGDPATNESLGIYYLTTNSESPFAVG